MAHWPPRRPPVWDDDFEEDIHVRRHAAAPVRTRERDAVNIAIYEDRGKSRSRSRSPSHDRGRNVRFQDNYNLMMREAMLHDQERELARVTSVIRDKERDLTRQANSRRSLPTDYDREQDAHIRDINRELEISKREKYAIEREMAKLAVRVAEKPAASAEPKVRREVEYETQLVRLRSRNRELQRAMDSMEEETEEKKAIEMALIRRDDAERRKKADEERALELYKLELQKKEDAERDLAARILAKREKDIADKRAKEEELKKKWELEEREKQLEKEEWRKRIAQEEKDKKEKEKREMEEWKEKIEKKEREEKEKKEKADEAAKEFMRKQLRKQGISEKEIEKLVDNKKTHEHHEHHEHQQEKLKVQIKTGGNGNIRYVRVSKKKVDPETLKFFGLPWDYDEEDDEMIVIYRDLERHDYERLVKYTKVMRRRVVEEEVGIENRRGRDGKKKLVMTRRRSVSTRKNQREDSPKRVLKLFG